MNVLQIIIGLTQPILFKIFPFLTYKGVITKQINIYKVLKKRRPEMSENDLLNHLIISRIEAPPRVAPKEEEYEHYRPLLENPNKTLEDVIWAIIEYENIVSRGEYVFNRLSKIGLSPLEVLGEMENFKAQVVKEIEESIEKKVEKRG
jgi:hypothetical protein